MKDMQDEEAMFHMSMDKSQEQVFDNGALSLTTRNVTLY